MKTARTLLMFLLAGMLSLAAAGQSRLTEDPIPSRRAAAAHELLSSLQGPKSAGPARFCQHADGALRFIGAPATGAMPTAPGAPADAARGFLRRHAAAFGLEAPAVEMEPLRVNPRHEGATVRLGQTYAGIPVFGAQAVVQLRGKTGVACVLSDVMRDTAALDTGKVSLAPALGADEAVWAAQTFPVHDAPGAATAVVEGPDLVVFDPSVIGCGGFTRLAWSMVRIGVGHPHIRERVLVDAATGEVFLHFSLIHAALAREVYDSQNTEADPGTLVRLEGDAPTTSGSNPHTHGLGVPEADVVYEYFGDVYEFYWNEHGRDSLDGAGAPLSATVRWCIPEQCPLRNAFWDGGRMYFGEGYGEADDVVAHELTHGVTEHESQLIYYGQSGAINESFSDIWGELVDLTNGAGDDSASVRWLMGEDLPIGAIRNMKNPPAGSDPDSTCSPYWWDEGWDNGGVHINSGVGNKLCYLLADGDSFRGYTVPGLGLSLTADLFYECQVNLLTPGSDYLDLYHALTQAAVNLGLTAAQRDAVETACQAVAITPETTCMGPPENDDCENALEISANTYYTGTTISATGDEQIECDGLPLGDIRDVWFRFVPLATEMHTIATCASDFDTTLAVFEEACGAGLAIACNDDSCERQAVVTPTLTAGTPYLIRLSGWGGAVGQYSLRVTPSTYGTCPEPLLREGFTGGIPAGWSVVDNDGRTPVFGFFTDAWIATADLEDVGDMRAVSTSWYDPAGTADDWLITPQVQLDGDSTLFWDAVGFLTEYPEGYEVRVSTSGPQLSGFLAHPPLFSTTAESVTWVSHSVNLADAGYANQPVHLAFRNNTVDGWWLMVDNIEICGAAPMADNDITINPTYYIFMDHPVGTGPSAPVYFTIGNGGPDPLEILDVGFTGAGAADFVIASDTGEPTLAQDATRTVGVSFDPLSTGDKVAYLTIQSNDLDDPDLDIYLWGRALGAPDLALSAGSLDFGYRIVGGAEGTALSLTLENTGTADLTITGVGIGGTDGGDFSLVSDTGETSLAPGADRVLGVQFKPTATGARTATLTIASNDPDTPSAEVALTGTGFNAASGAFSPVWVDFAHAGEEDGTVNGPFDTMAEGADFVTPAGTVYMKAGSTAAGITTGKPMRVEAFEGVVRIGAP